MRLLLALALLVAACSQPVPDPEPTQPPRSGGFSQAPAMVARYAELACSGTEEGIPFLVANSGEEMGVTAEALRGAFAGRTYPCTATRYLGGGALTGRQGPEEQYLFVFTYASGIEASWLFQVQDGKVIGVQ